MNPYYISLFAIALAGVSFLVAIYNSIQQHRHNRATTIPILEIEGTYDPNSEIEVRIHNAGSGPAIVTNAIVRCYVDGTEQIFHVDNIFDFSKYWNLVAPEQSSLMTPLDDITIPPGGQRVFLRSTKLARVDPEHQAVCFNIANSIFTVNYKSVYGVKFEANSSTLLDEYRRSESEFLDHGINIDEDISNPS